MQLSDLKKSITQISREEGMSIIFETRKKRLDFTKTKENKRKTKATTSAAKRETKNLRDIKQDKDKRAALIAALKELD